MNFPIAVAATSAPHFSLNLAAASLDRCLNLLRREFPGQFSSPKSVITRPPREEADLATVKDAGPKALILVQGAFTWDDIAVGTFEYFGKIPTLLWAMPEPDLSSGELTTNSLCGALMNNAAFHKLGIRNLFLYGDPDDPATLSQLRSAVGALRCAGSLDGARYGMVGYRPTGFYNSTFDELRVRRDFGIETRYLDLADLAEHMEAMDPQRVKRDADASRGLGRPGQADEAALLTGARVHLALQDFIVREDVHFLGMRCWPELMRRGANPCLVLGRLTDEGVPAACESDFGGALTMHMLARISGTSPWLADIIHADSWRGSLLFWHCGAAPASLTDPTRAPVIEKQFRGLDRGPTLEFLLKPGPVTVARLGMEEGRWRIFAFSGTAVAPETAIRGNLSEIVPEASYESVVERMAQRHVEHHLAIAYGHWMEALAGTANLLGIEFHRVR